jgi:nicotinate-nucleotide adenylyltransferase
MRVGLLGGLFSPPHHGHVIAAQEARIQLDLDEVWLLPVANPPHREMDPDTDPGDELRLNMCRLAIIGQPGLQVSTIEVDRGGTSYTVDTLESLAESNPDTEFTLIIGADQAMAFGNWRDPERIGALAEIAVATRVDHDRAQALSEVTRATGGKEPRGIDMPRVDISSSLIRERLIGGATVAHLVPAGIAELIEEKELYR